MHNVVLTKTIWSFSCRIVEVYENKQNLFPALSLYIQRMTENFLPFFGSSNYSGLPLKLEKGSPLFASI